MCVGGGTDDKGVIVAKRDVKQMSFASYAVASRVKTG